MSTAENNSNALDMLRENIEQECRFKTVLQGFDKKSVQEYINTLKESSAERIAQLENEKQQLLKEKNELTEMLAQRKLEEKEIRGEERSKLSSELDVREGLVARLREQNRALEDENRQLAIKLEAERQSLAELRRRFSGSVDEIEALSSQLSKLLTEKFDGILSLADAWQNEYRETIEVLRGQVFVERD